MSLYGQLHGCDEERVTLLLISLNPGWGSQRWSSVSVACGPIGLKAGELNGSTSRLSTELAVLLLVIPVFACTRTEVEPENNLGSGDVQVLLEDLVAAAGDGRIAQPWVAPFDRYVTCETSGTRDDLVADTHCRDLPKPGTTEFRELSSIGLRIRDLAANHPSPRTLYLQGLWRLLWHESGSIDSAIAALEQAVEAGNPSPELLNDYGAALYVRAQQLDQPLDLARALAVWERGREATPTDPRLLFNTTLGYASSSLYRFARESARSLSVQLGPDSAWSAAAEDLSRPQPSDMERWESVRTRLRRDLSRGDFSDLPGYASRLPLQVRQHLERELLNDWIGSVKERGGTKAVQRYKALQATAHALYAATGDAVYASCFGAQEGASAQSERTVQRLAEGFDVFREGRERYERKEYVGARRLFFASRDLLRNLGPYCSEWPEFYAATSVYYLRDYAESVRTLRHMLARIEDQPTAVLRGHVLWMLGLNNHVLARRTEALSWYRRAVVDFRQAGELQSLAAMYNQTSNVLFHLGAHEAAWRQRYLALRLHPNQVQATRRATVLTSVVRGLERAGLFSVAHRFQEEQLSLASQGQDVTLSIVASRRLAELFTAEGRHDEATQALARAASYLGELPRSQYSSRIEAQFDLAMANAWAPLDSDTALRHVESAFRAFNEPESQYEDLSALSLRAELHRRVGSTESAQRDFEAALGRAKRALDSLRGSDQLRYLTAVKTLFDRAIAFELEEVGSATRALELHELHQSLETAAVAVSFPSSVPAHRDSRSIAELRRELPEGVQLLVFRLQEQRLLRWVVGRSAVAFESSALEGAHRTRLTTLTRKLRTTGDRTEFEKAAGELYDLLLRPIADHLTPGTHLVVVPSSPLHRVPFDALRDSETGRFLIERHPLSIAPSLTDYVRLAGRFERTWNRPPQSILAIGGPRLVAADARNALPFAVSEAQRVGSFYPDAEVLTTEAASKQAILTQSGSWSVFHFAGHAVTEERDPLSLKLLVGDDEGDGAGALDLADLAALSRRVSHLIVLSSCQSAVAGDGSINPSVAVLAGETPALLATLWAVGDRSAEELLVDFHRHLATGMPLAEALRAAKLQALRSQENDVGVWPAFQLLGGVTPLPNMEGGVG